MTLFGPREIFLSKQLKRKEERAIQAARVDSDRGDGVPVGTRRVRVGVHPALTKNTVERP